MTRFFARAFLLCTICLLAVGPVLAAPNVQLSPLAIGAPTSPASPHADPLNVVGAPIGFAMAIRVKDIGTISKKFVQRAQAAAGDYTEGVRTAGADWEANTKAAEDNYKQGVQAAANRGAFGKGVAQAGQAKYTARATTLGAQRYPSGIGASEGDFAKGMQPVLQTLSSLNLPPRRPKGDPANYQRSNAVAAALRAMKVGQ